MSSHIRTNCLLVFIFILSFISCSIQISGPHKKDDGSTSLSQSDSASLRTFSMEHLGKEQDFQAQNQKLFFEEINSNEIKQIIPTQNYTWVMIWATWCPHGHNDIIRCSKLVDKYKDKGLNFINVCQVYDIPSMTKKFSNVHFYVQSYLLSAKDYGTNEWGKVKKFSKEICPKVEPVAVTPQHFIFNRKGELIYHRTGEFFNPDTLNTIFK